ncbi:MAG: hypothetical protein JXM69_05785 [Anaerolineae bacterium]|nr:hypothetical protein [Anaerolineae bacterium]
MFVRFLLHWGGLTLLGLFLVACGASPASTSTPDLVATEVAVKKAAAATLTAEAMAQQPPATTETAPSGEEAAAPATPTPTPSPTTDQTTGDTIQSQSPTDTPTSSPRCAVVTNGLNMRPGPGVVYEPPLRSLPQNMALIPLARIADNTWIEVQVQESGEVGWVSTGAQFITCNIDVSGLPLGQIPPTPTPTLTPTPIPPTPTPIPPQPTLPDRVDVPVDGGRADLDGHIRIPGFTKEQLKGPDSEVTFRDRLVFQVVAYNPNQGQHDGAGIKEVNIQIFGPNGKVHERTERNAGYCVFGGGEPDCNVFKFDQNNYRWPEEGQPSIENGSHSVEITITTEDNETENWRWSFWIQKK